MKFVGGIKIEKQENPKKWRKNPCPPQTPFRDSEVRSRDHSPIRSLLWKTGISEQFRQVYIAYLGNIDRAIFK